MIKLKHVVLPSPEQMEFIVEGMRNPKNSWDRSDSEIKISDSKWGDPYFTLGTNDADLMGRLAAAGTEHRKYMRMMPVMVRITAPLYWWKEFDTYKVSTVRNSCSTMHKIQEKEFTLEDFSCEHLTCFGAATRNNKNSSIDDEQMWELDFDYMGALLGTIKALNSARERYLKRKDKQLWWQMIQLLPSSYNQTANVMLNYEVLANIYHQRKNHKLDEWVEFCKWIETLPYSELITG